MKFTLLTRDRADYPVDRFSERKESAGGPDAAGQSLGLDLVHTATGGRSPQG